MSDVEKTGDRLLREAVLLRASDIHIVPEAKKSAILFRLDNQLLNRETIRSGFSEKLVSHFKFLAGMDIGERRKPQNGSFQLVIEQTSVNFRLSTLPTLYQESLVIRILPQEKMLPLQRLSLFEQQAKILQQVMKRQHGLFVLTGPTGSGKTTTLYSMIHEARVLYNRNIITLEDPIEKRSEGVLQVQINEKAGITYQTGLKAALRHDPDVIMVGEIRDPETAKIAITAAMTGHLVISTMHTKSANSALYRLTDLGVSPKDLRETLTMVAAQRLVDLACPFCEKGCSKHCRVMKKVRRLAIFEILDGVALQNAFMELDGLKVPSFRPTLQDILNKGIALGYVSQPDDELVEGKRL